MVPDTMSLADLPKVLRSMTGQRVTYAALYRLAVDGDLPASKNISNRWRVKSVDLPVIAEMISEKSRQMHGA